MLGNSTRRISRLWIASLAAVPVLGLTLAAGCDLPDPTPDDSYHWALAADAPATALLSVHGTSARNVFAVGADSGHGPLVLHWDGEGWQRLETGITGDFWWVHAVNDVVFMTGSDANIVRFADGAFERMSTPGLGKHIVFGLWAASKSDVYAVGSKSGRNGFIWHFDGSSWIELELPDGIPQDENHDIPQFVKVWGTSPDDVWVVGEQGVILRGNAADGFAVVDDPSEEFLFTVHGVGERVVAVGGNGVVLDIGSVVAQEKIQDSALLQGVWVSNSGDVWTTGAQGGIYRSRQEGFARQETGISREIQSLHAVWVDPDDGVWAVGGNVLDTSLNNGVLLYGHPANPAPTLIEVEDPAETIDNSCPAAAIDPAPQGSSIARRWNGQILNAIRRDVPRPTVHARNLFHLSAAMWDVWAAYDSVAVGYLIREKHTAADVDAALDEAISYAAYRVLTHRYSTAVGGAVSQSCFDGFMAALGYDPDFTDTTGDSPAAFGNRVGQAYVAAYANDGANEQNNYADPAGYTTDVPRLVVDEPGSNTADPIFWQQLVLAEAVTQNGIPEGAGVQPYIGSHWRDVTPFALIRAEPGAPYYDIAAPTTLDDDLVDAAVDILRKTAELDVENGATIDISPGAYGNNPLGTNDGTGHPLNPVTGEPYAPNIALQGDFTRVLSEFWADGPSSETPPGHWNTIANDLVDNPNFERRLFGAGAPLDPLAWDVHVYLALNGAVHDAAIAAWELKRTHITARPITLIRTMGQNGQRSDPAGPSYHPDGLPLEDGLIEVITAETAAPGQRHAHLRRYVGEIAVYSWRGEPGDRETEVGGIGWIRAKDWVPYQRRTFVTPAFPGFVSGHSTFSRSAAEVLTRLTGSPYFPDGLGGYHFVPGTLFFESGPTTTVDLQWATYYDAADQAGQSRLWGGIHVRQDDFGGRIIGAEIGNRAVDLASIYYDGSAAGDAE